MPVALVRFFLPLLMFMSSKAGAVGAGATGAGLSVAVAEGAIATPAGMPVWLAALLAGVGPAVAWLFTRVVASGAAYFLAKRDNARKRAADMLAMPINERGPESGPVVRAYLDKADDADAIAAALQAFRAPNTNGGAR